MCGHSPASIRSPHGLTGELNKDIRIAISASFRYIRVYLISEFPLGCNIVYNLLSEGGRWDSVSEAQTWPSTLNGFYFQGQGPKVRLTPVQLNGRRSLWERIERIIRVYTCHGVASIWAIGSSFENWLRDVIWARDGDFLLGWPPSSFYSSIFTFFWFYVPSCILVGFPTPPFACRMLYWTSPQLSEIKTFSCCSDQADCCNNYTPLGFWQLNAATWFLLLPEEYSMTTVPTSISGPQMRAALNVVVLLCLLTSMLLTALVSGVSSGLSKEQNHHFDHTT